jgi:hypothetical protein
MPRLKELLVAGSIALIPCHAFAQTTDPACTPSARSSDAAQVETNLVTSVGQDLSGLAALSG